MKHASDMPGRTWRERAPSGASVFFYGSDEPHELHEHDAAHVSVVLAGALEESSGREIVAAASGGLRIRREGFRHAVTFGHCGALLLTLPAPSDNAASWSALADCGWLTLQRRRRCWDVLRNLLTGVACDPDDATAELIAIASPIENIKRPPRWLLAARERIVEEPARARVHAMATEAGVHRVHFARLFDAAFGSPPSVYRRRAMLDRAIAAILEHDQPLAAAAAEAGFADQAHMSRAFAEFLGTTPARLRASLE